MEGTSSCACHFGLKMSLDIFQMCMAQVTDCLPGIIMIHNDICIYGWMPEEHDWNLIQLKKTVSQNGVTINSSNCRIRQPKISFYGAVFTTKCMIPNPSKISALWDLPTPNSLTKLQSFLGLVNYLQPLIPGLTDKTMFLWEQFAEWDWNPMSDAAFHHLMVWIDNTLLNTTVGYYDRIQPVIVQTNGSEYGLGTAFIQNGQPTAFASKTLTDVETHYAIIESACQCVLASKNSTPTYTASMSSSRMTTSPWRWYTISPYMLYLLACSACYFTCKSMTIQSSTSPARTLHYLTTWATSLPTRSPSPLP